MKTDIVIGSTNSYKISVISETVSLIDPEIKLIRKRIPKSKIFPETNDYPLENAKQKALFYGKLFHKNVLSEDDALLINNEIISLHRKNGKFQTKKQIYNYWFNFLKKQRVLRGKLIKAYAFYKDNNILFGQVEKNIKLELPKNKIEKINGNPLNYFIVPKGFLIPLSEFSKNQLIRFRKPETKILKIILN